MPRNTPTGRPLRADIQALRALAVAGVVAYHLWPHGLPGGFVGVDVFFVISGFLITQLLLDEQATGHVSLTRFWARRIRRLLPAAYTVLVASVALLLLGLPRVIWPENLLEARAAAGYVENWLLGGHAVDYLASDNSASLVQHYWSLSVEEQFYIAWPLLLLAAHLLARRATPPTKYRVVTATLALVAVLSFIYSLQATAADAPTAFFSTPARGWEFAAGGLVAALRRRSRHARPTSLDLASTLAGVTLIGACYVTISSSDPFPGWVALLPVAGAVLVVRADTSGASWSVLRVARGRAVQWVGDASYSIYLWHWPLIVAAPWLLHRPLTWPSKLGIVVASLALAAATMRFVEQPARTARWLRRRQWPAYAFAVCGLAALVSVTSVEYDATQQKLRAASSEAAAQAATLSAPTMSSTGGRGSAAHPVRYSCYGAAAMVNHGHCPNPFARPPHLDTAFAADDGRTYDCLAQPDATAPNLCTFGETRHPRRTIALVGNSHARRLVPALDVYGKQHGWRIVVATKINCMGVVDAPVNAQSPNDPCLVWSQGILHKLLVMHLDAVVFASHLAAKHFLTGSYNPSARELTIARQRVLDTWSRFTRGGTRVIVTEDVPGVRPNSDPECIAMSDAAVDPCAVSRASAERSNVLAAWARQNPQLVRYLPLRQYFCDVRRCHGLIGGLVVYFDSNHLTATFARSMAPYLGAQLRAVLSDR